MHQDPSIMFCAASAHATFGVNGSGSFKDPAAVPTVVMVMEPEIVAILLTSTRACRIELAAVNVPLPAVGVGVVIANAGSFVASLVFVTLLSPTSDLLSDRSVLVADASAAAASERPNDVNVASDAVPDPVK